MKRIFLILLFPFAAWGQYVSTVLGNSGVLTVTGAMTYLQSQAMAASGTSGPGVQACTNSNQHCTITLVTSTTSKSDMTVMLESYTDTVNVIDSAYSCATLTAGVCNSGNAIDTFSLCAASACNIQNATHDNVDVAYVAQSVGGANFITVNAHVDPTSAGFNVYFQEALPPKCNGTTCNSTFDTNAKCSSVSACSSTTIAATDLMLGALDTANAVTAHNYSIEQTGNLFGFDLTSAPAFTITTSGYWTTSRVFFQTSGGSYSPSTPLFSAVNPAPPQSNVTIITACSSSSCTITPATGSAGNGAILFAFGDKTISSVSGRGGTWTAPSGANTCQNALASANISCAYNLALSGGQTGAITATMSGTCASCFLSYMEWSRTSGSNVLDVQGSSTGVGTTTLSGQTLTLNGSTADACFYQMGWTTSTAAFQGGGVTLYPYPGGANFIGWYNNPQKSTVGMLLNVTGATTVAPQNNLTTGASATTSVSSGLCIK